MTTTSVQKKHYDISKYGTIVYVQVFTNENGTDMAKILFNNGECIEAEWLLFAFYAIGLTTTTIWHDARKRK